MAAIDRKRAMRNVQYWVCKLEFPGFRLEKE